jgi:NADH-ubiquinone oxidoreductase chain 5
MKSALSAVLLNRMGDTFFMIAIASLIAMLNTVDYHVINLIVPHAETSILTLVGFCFLIAAVAKSAQLGLHS